MGAVSNEKTRIAAVIPAAGASSRFEGGNKLLHALGDSTVIESVLSRASRCGLSEIIVVTGSEADRVRALATPFGARCAFSERHTAGMGRSIAVGVASAPDSIDGFLIWPGDMPFISDTAVLAVLAAFERERIVVPTFASRRGHPVLFPALFRTELEALDTDRGARSVLSRHADAVLELPVDDAGIHHDIDTEAQLRAGADRPNLERRP